MRLRMVVFLVNDDDVDYCTRHFFVVCCSTVSYLSDVYIYINNYLVAFIFYLGKALATILYAGDPAAKVALAIAAEVMGFIVHVFYGIDALFEFKGEAV